jgi:hypothetical protein
VKVSGGVEEGQPSPLVGDKNANKHKAKAKGQPKQAKPKTKA